MKGNYKGDKTLSYSMAFEPEDFRMVITFTIQTRGVNIGWYENFVTALSNIFN